MTNEITVFFCRHFVTAFLLFTCSMLFTNCSNNNLSDKNNVEKILRNADASIENAVTNKNIDSLIQFYAENASMLPTAEPLVKGKAAIKEEWEHIFQIPDFTNKSNLTNIEISDDGSMAYTMGSYLATMQGEDGNEVQEPGKWVTIWKKQPDGRWLIVVDIYNTDIPPPDHK